MRCPTHVAEGRRPELGGSHCCDVGWRKILRMFGVSVDHAGCDISGEMGQLDKATDADEVEDSQRAVTARAL